MEQGLPSQDIVSAERDTSLPAELTARHAEVWQAPV